MHELSLMDGVLNTVRASSGDNGIIRVNLIKLVIGKLSMALPDSLQFAFEALKQEDEMFTGAVLEIEERPIAGLCNECRQEFEIDDKYCFICPRCEGKNVEIIGGRELYIEYFEGDEN